MAEPVASQYPPCEHAWQYRKPAHASASVRICGTCHAIDGEDLMRTLHEHAVEYAKAFKPKPASLLYGHSDGETFSMVDQSGGLPEKARERALLRALLTYTLGALDQYEMTGGMLAVAHD